MVYRGGPSKGCGPCRKAKKNCSLERPSCARCLRLGRFCSGYRDPSELQFRDETTAVIRRSKRSEDASSLLPNDKADINAGTVVVVEFPAVQAKEITPDLGQALLFKSLPIDPDDLAINCFIRSYTLQNGHRGHIVGYAAQFETNRCLTHAIKACGMAILHNAHFVPDATIWSRKMYGKALRILNESLSDTNRCTNDEVLIAVNVLSFYENLVCDGRESLHSWKAHIDGASQLLKLRSKTQLKSVVGRALFRETRAQIITLCVWTSTQPPAFLRDWAPILHSESTDPGFVGPTDEMLLLSFDFAIVRSRLHASVISEAEALASFNELEERLIDWDSRTSMVDERWRYFLVQVKTSAYVWNGFFHAYSRLPIPSVWNTYRCQRIMVSRAQQFLDQALDHAPREPYFRALRMQMANEICASIPCQLGYAPSPAFSSPCVLVTAYNTIWPLFHAGQCVLESLHDKGLNLGMKDEFDVGTKQLSWILGRFEYISQTLGLRWAHSVAVRLHV